MPAGTDKPWDVGVVSATRRSSGMAPRACVYCVRVYARVLAPGAGATKSLHTYMQHMHMHTPLLKKTKFSLITDKTKATFES